jgi:hypothetical protein
VTVTLQELAEWVRGEVVGDGGEPISDARPLSDARPGDITFVEDPKHYTAWHSSTASAAFVPPDAPVNGKPVIRVPDPLTAFALAVEIGDWHRFTGNSIGSFVGLVPCEHSSGASRVQGSITKTGNGHARRLLVEAAWHHRARYAPGKTMRDRWQLAPPAARDRGDAGNRRLHARWVEFAVRRKRPVIANVAIARELAGWCWSLAVMD